MVMSAVPKISGPEVLPADDAMTAHMRAWQRRRRWTRTDTARWLNDRGAPLLAWLRRRGPHAPSRCVQVGYWLKDEQTSLFDRAHRHLAACANDADRDGMIVEEVMR
jgi:hypothetical protein